MRLLPHIAAACLLLAAGPGQAEPLTLDRLLAVENFGTTAVSPDGRYAVIETQAPYASAPSFDFEDSSIVLGRLLRADLQRPGLARPLFPAEPGAGYVAGPFSPSGAAMIVYRWKDRIWDTGVVELSSGAVRWLGLATERALYGRSLVWRSETQLVLIALPDDSAPIHARLGWQNKARLPELWTQQAQGRVPSLVVLGSGADRPKSPQTARRLVQVDLVSGDQRTLAKGGFFDLELSPSGRFAAAIGDAEPVGLGSTDRVRLAAPVRRRDLAIINLDSGAVASPCPDQDVLTQLLSWSSKGDRLLVYGHRVDQPDASGRLQIIDASAARATPLSDAIAPEIDYGDEGIGVVRADWWGETPIVYGRPGRSGRADWYALLAKGARNLTVRLDHPPTRLGAVGSDALLMIVDGRAWRVDRRGRATRLVKDAGLSLFSPATFGLGARLSVNGAPRRDDLWVKAAGQLVRLDRQGRTVWSAGDAEEILAPAGDSLLVQTRSPSGVRAVRRLLANGSARDLAVINTQLAKVDPIAVQVIDSVGPQGQMLKNFLYLPPAATGAPKPALIVVPYPGWAPQSSPRNYLPGAPTFTPSPLFLASQGYAVLAPALPIDRSLGEPVRGLADRILGVVDQIAAEGLIDADRLAIWGHSYGGYGALTAATQTGRFKAIIAQNAPTDLISTWGTIDPYYRTAPEDGAPNALSMGWAETGQGAMQGPPWSDTARYLRYSPLMAADKITTPVALITGDQDFVSLGQSEAMFSALYRQNKDAKLITLFGERHLPRSPANIRGLYAEILPWLAARLAPTAATRSSQ